MELKTLTYREAGGWSEPIPREMDSDRTLVLIFAGAKYGQDSTVLVELVAGFPESVISGCSTFGEIMGREIHEDSIVAAIVKFRKTRLVSASALINLASESFSAGADLARQLRAPDLKGVLILSDGQNVNGSELVRGLNSLVPKEVVVTGGLAGSTPSIPSWVIHNRIPRSLYVTAVGFYGQAIHISHGCKGGWDIFGPERQVTRSEGNVLYELDGKPALILYKEYLGNLAALLPKSALLFPLSLRRSSHDTKIVVRSVLAVDEKNGSMAFGGDIPKGFLAQLMRANLERLITAAADSAGMTRAANPGPALAVVISCMGRRVVLGERAEEEIEAGLDALPPGVVQMGFYSHGEISPVRLSVASEFHNQTVTYTTFSEDTNFSENG